ncbi:hypothetical protein PoB_000227200 [Plakobranchus ocellatus]|uniref:Uncharacterized protein n=1 Tax=Plakobranchus ocellatus TaxID=259542 RepID=A0AAV3XZ58_9GAST|nr:hypothetical protein PoB_000227200 [Plakobranchus ocellatus]
MVTLNRSLRDQPLGPNLDEFTVLKNMVCTSSYKNLHHAARNCHHPIPHLRAEAIGPQVLLTLIGPDLPIVPQDGYN